MICNFIILSIATCAIANEIKLYVGEIVGDSEPIKTKKGQLCYGIAYLPHVIVTTCSCAIGFGGIVQNKLTDLNGKTKFKVPTKGAENKPILNEIIAVGVHEKCKDYGKIWAFDIAMGKLKQKLKEILSGELPKQFQGKCEVFQKSTLEPTSIKIDPADNGSCEIPPYSETEKAHSYWLQCITGANCNYGIGTPLICQNTLKSIMVSQDCTSTQNSIALSIEAVASVPGFEQLTIEDVIKSDKSRGKTIIPNSLMLFISIFYT